MALAHAIAICAKLGMALPEWAAAAYVGGYRDILNYHADSWNSLFGSVIPKGQHLNASRKEHRKSYLVWTEIETRTKKGAAADDGLFEEVGKKFGLGKTLVKSYYASERKTLEALRAATEIDEAQQIAWIKAQIQEAQLAIDAGRNEHARDLIEGIEAAYLRLFGVKPPT